MAYLESRVGRCLGALVAASLLAGVSAEAGAVGSKGTIFFTTGKTLSNFHFTYAPPGGSETGDKQTFKLLKGCTVDLDPGSTGSYVDLSARKGTDTGASLGYMASSIGVYDGPQGTACGRVSQVKDEALTLSLLGSLPNDANAFDRLQLDLEVKGDVVLKLDVKFDNREVSYYLLSGAGVAPAEADPSKVWNCNLTSDSGPDAGAADNCIWVVDEIGKSFTITPLAGEFSFEGGYDHADLEKRTKIFLTEADGILACDGSPITAAEPTMSCNVTRLNPGTCSPVAYVFRSSGGTCTLTVDTQEQLVANLLVSYKPEPATGTLQPPNDTSTWQAAPLSKVKFATSDTTFYIPACRGFDIDDGTAPSPITPPPDDWVSSTEPVKEFACAFQRLEIFETNGSSGVLETWITEGIQFWGDISFSRTGPGG